MYIYSFIFIFMKFLLIICIKYVESESHVRYEKIRTLFFSLQVYKKRENSNKGRCTKKEGWTKYGVKIFAMSQNNFRFWRSTRKPRKVKKNNNSDLVILATFFTLDNG